MKRILGLTGGLMLFGMVGCETDDARMVDTEQEIVTEPATETVEVERMTEDTLMVERTTEVEVDVDTVDVEGTAQPTTGTQRMDTDAGIDTDTRY